MAFPFINSKHLPLNSSVLALLLVSCFTSPLVNAHEKETKDEYSFKRIATFPVFLNSSIENKTVSEIVAVSNNGKTLIYTDGKLESIGFVDIRNPKHPQAAGVISVGGEPTSVAVTKHFALAAVNTSTDFVDVSGHLTVIDIRSQKIIRNIPLGGQPDSIAISPDGNYAAIAIENERNEDLNDGMMPQSPPGKLIIVDLKGKPKNWTLREVSMTGLDGMLYPSDPEPEFVDINKQNIAVVTLQENNHIALVNLKTAKIINHFSAGTQDLDNIDIAKDHLITPDSSLKAIPREPDGVSWLNNSLLVTADEGDMKGGSRGFTIYNKQGEIQYAAGNSVEHLIMRLGHYPDKRSGKKGNEPENVEVGKFKGDKLLFVGSERASVALVYNINIPSRPVLKQVLPTAVKPEGLLAIPGRNLFVTAGEKDARDDKIRSALTLYEYTRDKATYPTVISDNRDNGTPIPWGALSGLAIDPDDDDILYTIHDSFYNQARIFKMAMEDDRAIIQEEIILMDSLNKLATIDAKMVNYNGTVNIDQEGIAMRKAGGFWIASEGKGTVGSTKKPFKSKNYIFAVSEEGVIEQVIQLPEATNQRQIKFGLEGVTSTGSADHEILYVAFQRAWAGDNPDYTRIGRYDVNNAQWHFYYYPLEAPLSAAGGWVGLSEITALDDENFLVIERDNQANADAEIKRIYQFSVAGLTPKDESQADFPIVKKTLRRDLMPDLAKTNGLILEKIEGMAINHEGEIYIINDNDGVDDSNGETQLLKID